jgi:hypothetical protein
VCNKKLLLIDPNQRKIPLMEHYDRKYNWWTDRKGVYEATFGMFGNELLGGMKLKKN